MTEQEAKAVNMYKLYAYTKSQLFTELKTAKKVYKEQPFYINVKAKEVFENATDDNILVQGIIDLFYINEDDEIVLVDYKTDYVEDGKEDDLVKKYRKQLDIYKKAIYEAMGKEVKHCYIYSVYLEKTIEIN